MEGIVTLQEELIAVKEQLSDVVRELEETKDDREIRIILRKEKVLLLQDKQRLENQIAANNPSNAVTPLGIYHCIKSVYVNYVCIYENLQSSLWSLSLLTMFPSWSLCFSVVFPSIDDAS